MSNLWRRKLVKGCIASAAIYPEITENSYGEFCDNISLSSLIYNTNSVENVIYIIKVRVY